jgi:2-keto-myo-inositol isomerase
MVHLSGVTDQTLATAEMRDEHRLLVDAKDRLGNLDQIETLMADGYLGPLSMEAFAPEVHSLISPGNEIARSFGYIQSRVRENVVQGST